MDDPGNTDVRDLLALLPPPHIVVRDAMRTLAYGFEQRTGHLHNVAADLLRATEDCDDCDGDNDPSPCGDCEVRISTALILMTLTDPAAVPRLSKAQN